MKSLSSMIFLYCVLTSPVFGQSFNIDFGQEGAGPPDTYAAAGLAGHWISTPGTQGVTIFNLVDINGVVTNARMSQIGGTETLLVNDQDLDGDDATLMNDVLITHTAVENCLFFYDMQPGMYEVLIYARMPAQPAVQALTNVDEELGNPHILVGGEWPGQHEAFISYSQHIAEVLDSGPNAGLLRAHSGVPEGGDYDIGAALNGIQIRLVEELIPGDVDGDGIVNIADLLALLAAWGSCAGCAEDVNGDSVVDILDLLTLLANWG